jgi:hypothetical protein
MPRNESDREDLLREATALVERVELRVAGMEESIVAGFRRDGAASFFFGADPVYQFNAAGELRRAFVGGLLYKTNGGRLVAMRRERTAEAVELHSRQLDVAETATFLSQAEAALDGLKSALAAKQFEVVGQVSHDISSPNVATKVSVWLAARPTKITLAATPKLR